MAIKIKKGDSLALLNLTPIIDVVFNLLIFFLVATKFEEEDRELPIVLPQASEAMPLTVKPREVFVNIDESGRYFVSGQYIDEAQLEQALLQAAADNPGRQKVFIRADERSDVRHAVTVMNLCNRAGIRDYAITTAGLETPPPAALER
jgi:biopolymer transport protein ExbD